jgi:hypothetical protein
MADSIFEGFNSPHRGCAGDPDCEKVLREQDEERAFAQQFRGIVPKLFEIPAPGMGPSAANKDQSYQLSPKDGLLHARPHYNVDGIGGDRPPQGPIGIPSETAAGERTPIDRLLAEGRAAMYGGGDMKTGIQAATKPFSQAVEMSTTGLVQADRVSKRAHEQLGPDADAEMKAMLKGNTEFSAAMGKITDPKARAMAMRDFESWMDKDESDAAYAGLSTNLEKNGLLTAARDLKTAVHTPAINALTKVESDMAMAVEQAISAREAYARGLNEAGNSLHDKSMTDKAWELERQAVALTKRLLPKHRPEPELAPGQQKA